MKKETTVSNRLVLGTAQLTQRYGVTDERQFSEIDSDRALEILGAASKLGIKHLDTAPSYGTAEEIISRTNFGFSVDTKVASIEDAIPSVLRSSQKLLGLKIRTIFFHEALTFSQYEIDKISELATLKGILFEKIGVSIYTFEEFDRAVESGLIDSVQVPYSALDRRFSEDTLAPAVNKGIRVHARSLFAQGLLPAGRVPNFRGSERLSVFLNNFWAVCQKYDVPYDFAAIQWAARNSSLSYLIFGANSVGQVSRIVEGLDQPSSYSCQEAIDQLSPPDWPATDPRRWV